MSQNVNTIYNNVVISDSTNNTTTTLDNTSINFGSNLLTIPLNTTYSNSGITTPISNISFGELFIIRDSVQAVALPIPNDGLTFKVVDTIEIANQENPIGATKTNYGYNSITASNGLTVNGLTTFSNDLTVNGATTTLQEGNAVNFTITETGSIRDCQVYNSFTTTLSTPSTFNGTADFNDIATFNGLTTFPSICPQTPVIPTLPDDLVNLNYLQNNPPASAVIFYLNNNLTPTPAINTYKLLGAVEDGLAQSSISTTISGIGTIQFIQGFANQLINLNAGSFIPSGIWDLNIFASADNSGSTTHINLYFAVFGRTSLGVETQIGTNSSLVSVDAITVEQLKMTLALPYTPISAYESLVIKLYGICNRSASTSITTFYEETTTYSHLHTTFGVYVPPSILSLNNTFTGLNTFSQYITAPDIIISNSISTNAFTQSSSTITLNLGSYQYKNFSFTMNQNITAFNLSNGVSNGEYKIYLLGGGFIFNKNVGYKNSLAGNTLMATGSEWVIKIYCKSIGTYYMECLNFTL